MSTLLERQIMALLGRQFSRPLSPRRLRAPVPGGRDTVVPRVWGPPVWWDGPGDGTLRIEPGLLAFSGDPALPLTVYTTDDLADWLAGPGFAIPDSDPAATTHFVGRLEWTAETGPRWPEDPVLLDLGDDSYTSQVYSSIATLRAVAGDPPAARIQPRPSEWTGAARMRAEARLSAGRQIGDGLPTGCSGLPGRLHILWSEGDPGERRPWALDISDAGLIAHPLVVSDRTRPILDWIESGAVTGIAAHLAWLYVYADLAPDQESEPVEVLSADDLADAYQDGGPGPAMVGWVAPPHTGQPGIEMSCVLGGALDASTMAERYVTRLATISVAASVAAPPTGSVSVGAAIEWRVDPRCLLYVGDPESASALRNHPTYSGPVSGHDGAPVVCAYTSGGALEVLRYWVSQTRAASEDDEAAWGQCTTGGAGYTAYTSGLSKESVGYGVVRPAERLVGSGSVSVGSGSWENLTWQPWPANGTGQSHWSLWPGYAPDCGDAHWYPDGAPEMGDAPSGYWYWQHFQIRTQGGTMVGTVNSQIIAGADVRQVGVYWPAICPDGHWLATVTIASGRTDRTEWRRTYYAQYQAQWRPNWYWYDSSTSPPTGGWVQGSVRTGGPVLGWGAYWNSYPNTSGYTQGPGPLVWDATTELRLAGQSLAAGGWGDWDSWWPEPPEGASIGVTAIVAARGSALWIPYPGADWGRSGIGDAAPANVAQAWVGG